MPAGLRCDYPRGRALCGRAAPCSSKPGAVRPDAVYPDVSGVGRHDPCIPPVHAGGPRETISEPDDPGAVDLRVLACFNPQWPSLIFAVA
jgi:hypothetical protein